MKLLDSWIARHKKRALMMGRAMAIGGSALIVLGLVAFGLRQLVAEPVNFPSIAFFWLPESFIGFGIAAILLVVGLMVLSRAAWLISTGHDHHQHSVTQVMEPPRHD